MTKLDQCPSTKGKINPDVTDELRPAPRPTGREAWRSLDEYAGTPEFREFVEREFPAGASEMLESDSRRAFLKVMGAGLALAGAATVPGCRRPAREIMTYSRDVPEEIVPGKALYYATSLCLPGGGAEGLLVETHAGRPTHVEGNPQHPVNRGKSSVWAKASVLDIYDPDRLTDPIYRGASGGGDRLATWDDFKAWSAEHFAKFDATRGRGLAFVVDKKTSPTRNAMRDAVLGRWPGAAWVAWNPAEARGSIEGTRSALGQPMRVHHHLGEAQRVVSLDADFMAEGPEHLINAREFAKTRVVYDSGDDMSRLYVAESRPTATGSMADHRMRLSPSQVAAFAAELAGYVFAQSGNANGSRLAGDLIGRAPGGHDRQEATHAEQIAEDLVSHRGHAVVIAGPSQPAPVHALVAAINEALGASGSLVTYTPMSEEEAVDSAAALGDLAAGLADIDTIVCIGTNPVYDAPAASGFAQAFARVPTRISHSVGKSETEGACTWSLNAAHALESWGDAEAYDGTVSPVQPMIAPLYDPALSEIELLALLAGPDHGGSGDPDGFELVAATMTGGGNTSPDSPAFQKLWRNALHNGVMDNTARRPARSTVNWQNVAAGISAMGASDHHDGSLEAVFYTSHVADGSGANNAWLQELPEVGSTVVWDNPVCVSPATARDMGLLPPGADGDEVNPYTRGQMPQAKLATLSVGGRETEVAVWVLPGMPDNTVAVKLGYGRTRAGLVGNEVGHNTYLVKPAGARSASGATLRATGKTRTIASTQNHWSMESRTTIVRAMDKKWWDQHAAHEPVAHADHVYGTAYTTHANNVAEQMGELAHTPEPVSIYENPQNESRGNPAPGSPFSKGPQWGMTIDMNACSGCGVCTIACQSENNIPVVGKSEVAKGREMHWIRVDRYFTGDLDNPDQMLMQPVACVQCENAPCETVCPVNATVHGPEGTNNMAYNRCIGTRYCANNCPYKVRRFNFFDWGQSKFRGGLDASYVGEGVKDKFEEDVASDRKFNQNFIPPRLRAKLDEISKMQRNPDVTVRPRGVMEKCTYCIQRINGARQEVKVRGIWNDANQTGPIPDGFFQTACQQACPTDAIVFGDILDPASRVSKTRETQRSYMLLGYLDTRPRTTHLMRVRNPNPAIRVYDEHDPLHHGSHGDDHHEGGHDDHHDDHGDDHGGGHAYIDTTKKRHETGYALSLRILGQTGALA